MKIEFNGSAWRLTHRSRVLLEASPEHPLVYLGEGRESVEMYRGNFKIEDYLETREAPPLISVKEQDGGWLLDFGGRLSIFAVVTGGLAMLTSKLADSSVNRFWLRVRADEDEKCYGYGEQMSYFNLRGRHFPLWSSEPGVGRDKTTYVTWRSDVENRAGGDYYNTNFPQPTFMSSQMYYIHADCTAYADFDFRNGGFHELQFWGIPASIRIEGGDDWRDLLYRLSGLLGRQPKLPEWALDGLIFGVQGGTERAFGLTDRLIRNGVRVSGVWCQDWVGKRETSFGRRLRWNWQWNEDAYPGLPQKIKEYKEKGIHFLAYNNCYLVNDGALYLEAKDKGYLASALDGGDYLVDFGEFHCGVVDLTNPEAYGWYKDCIKEYMLDLGADGWMADFGEYLPTDIKLFSGSPALTEHNRWPLLWAKCNRDALDESGKAEDAFFFMRAGGAGIQRYCPLLWAGDQSVDFTLHDGLPTTIVAALSAGMSGFGLSHSDIGGYTSLFGNTRTKELFLRWAEMAVFTPLMRTHEGNRPDDNFQCYDDADTVEKLARLTDIRAALKPYVREVIKENAERGLPAQRALFIHYPDDAKAYGIQTQYLFGSDLLAAPVLEAGAEEKEVYLPEDKWVHLWSGLEFSGGRRTVKSPVGYPPVFYRKESGFAELFASLRM